MYPKLAKLVPIIFTLTVIVAVFVWVFIEIKTNKEIYKYKYVCEASLNCSPYYKNQKEPECVSNYWGDKMQLRKDGGIYEPFNIDTSEKLITCQCLENKCSNR